MSISTEQFRAAMGSFASGVTVVTTVDAEGHRWGLTVSAFSSVSLEPRLCLVCIDHRAGSLGPLKASGCFAVNVLAAEQEDVSDRFASRVAQKFTDPAWEPGPVTGGPVLGTALAWMECRVNDVVTSGDHDILIGEIVSVHAREGAPLLYWRGAYGDITSRPRRW